MTEYLAQFEMSQWQPLLEQWGSRLLMALLIFLIGSWLSRRVSSGMEHLLRHRGMDGIMVSFIGNLGYMALFAAVIIAALGSLGVETTSLLAVLGAAGLAVGLALKDSLGNLASGVMIVGLRPFREGDFVEVAGTSGTVSQVRMFNTTLITADNRQVLIPNSEVTSNTITNFTAMTTRRIDLVIGVSYNDDLKRVKEILERVAKGHEKVLKEPEPVILLLELGDSSVNFALRPWVNKEDYWVTRSDLLTQIKTELEAAGCSIPYPQRDIHHYHHNKGLGAEEVAEEAD